MPIRLIQTVKYSGFSQSFQSFVRIFIQDKQAGLSSRPDDPRFSRQVQYVNSFQPPVLHACFSLQKLRSGQF